MRMSVFVPRTPVFVNLDLTSGCNQQCIFCAVSPKRTASFQKKESFFNLIDRLYDAGVFEITFFGGEPLIYPQVEEVTKYAHNLGFELNIVTNGTFPHILKKLSKYLTNASISIHGFKRTHEKITKLPGSYELAIESLKLLSEENIDTAVCYTLIKSNYYELENFVTHIFSNYNTKGLVLDRFIPRGFGRILRDKLEVNIRQMNEALKKLDKLSREYKKGITTGDGLPLCKIEENLRYIVQPCQAGILFCSITESGYVKFCPSTETIIGNIMECSLEEIWNNRIYKNYRNFKWLPNDCKKCNLLLNCYGGCKASSGIEPYSYDTYLKKLENYNEII